MTTDIHIKTYPGDYEWLQFCLRSIDKYVNGHRDIVIVTDGTETKGEATDILSDYLQCTALPRMSRPEKVTIHEEPRAAGINMACPIPHRVTVGYQFMKGAKHQWYRYTDADKVFQIDSDMIFNKNFNLSTRTSWNRAKWSELPLRYLDDIQCNWEGIKWFAERPYAYSNMFLPGWGLTRRASEAFDLYLRHRFGEDSIEFFMNSSHPNQSAYHAFGIFLDIHMSYHGYRVIDWEFASPGDHSKHFYSPIRPYHSWSGMTPEIIREIEGVLA